MKRVLLLLLCLTGMLCLASAQVSQYVNPMIGTTGMGHCFPGACAPFGAVQLSPDMDTIPHNVGGKYQPRAYDYCAGYQYTDNTIVGFSHTHLSGTGHSDLGDILLMPQTGVPLCLDHAALEGAGPDPDHLEQDVPQRHPRPGCI